MERLSVEIAAPPGERPESRLWLYNVIEVARDHKRARIHTRALRKDGGAWAGWPVWPGSSELEGRACCEINFGLSPEAP